MKYCVKCGNPMSDDMIFCQKCGTKSELFGASDVVVNEKITSLKSYDICYKDVSWKEISKNPDICADYLGKRDYISQDLNNLIDEIISLTNDNNRSAVFEQLYKYIYKTCHELMQTMIKQLNNTSDREEFMELLKQALNVRKITPDSATNIVVNIENSYIVIVTLNFMYASQLINHIDKKDKYTNDYCRRETIILENEFSQGFVALNNRKKGILIPTPYVGASMIINWYFDIMDGLRKTDLDQISDNVWESHAQLLYNEGSREDADKYRQAIKDGRNRVYETNKEFEDEFWNKNPEIKAVKEKLDAEKKKLKKAVFR